MFMISSNTHLTKTHLTKTVLKKLAVSASGLLMAVTLFASPTMAEPVKTESAKSEMSQQVQATKSDKININTADAQTLADHLNGVGIKKAEAIVAYRDKNGPFKTAEDIVNVAGIGEAILAKNKDVIGIN